MWGNKVIYLIKKVILLCGKNLEREMKRDCGEGELIPHKFSLAWCVGKSDKELKKLL